MYCANLRKAFSIAVFAVAFALSLQAALAQKASASSPTGASSAKTNATTGSTPAGGGGSSSGSSSWTAGRGKLRKPEGGASDRGAGVQAGQYIRRKRELDCREGRLSICKTTRWGVG